MPQKKQKLSCSRIEGHNYTVLDYGKNKAFCMLIEPGMFIDFSVIILKFNINNSFFFCQPSIFHTPVLLLILMKRVLDVSVAVSFQVMAARLIM